ncbi:hypothetical protein ACVNPS_09045 [Candidatus Bipolaricaulota sp. J31]
MRRGVLFLGMMALFGVTALAISVTKGLGPPDTLGWCPADWLLGCTSGIAALEPEGLLLSNLSVPPPSTYELELKLLPYRALLFSFEGKQAGGHVMISLNGVLIEKVGIEEGEWWIRLEDLPQEGLLRLELDQYCESLLVRSIYFPCQGEAQVLPECKARFWEGILWGAGLTIAFLIMFYLLTGSGE